MNIRNQTKDNPPIKSSNNLNSNEKLNTSTHSPILPRANDLEITTTIRAKEKRQLNSQTNGKQIHTLSLLRGSAALPFLGFVTVVVVGTVGASVSSASSVATSASAAKAAAATRTRLQNPCLTSLSLQFKTSRLQQADQVAVLGLKESKEREGVRSCGCTEEAA